MEERVGYCPICDKELIITTNASMAYCSDCGHHVAMHIWDEETPVQQ